MYILHAIVFLLFQAISQNVILRHPTGFPRSHHICDGKKCWGHMFSHFNFFGNNTYCIRKECLYARGVSALVGHSVSLISPEGRTPICNPPHIIDSFDINTEIYDTVKLAIFTVFKFNAKQKFAWFFITFFVILTDVVWYMVGDLYSLLSQWFLKVVCFNLL